MVILYTFFTLLIIQLVLYPASYSNAENDDYFPVVEELSFVVVTANRQCINISVIDDTILENDDVFLVEALSTSLATPIQSTVEVIIANDDSK